MLSPINQNRRVTLDLDVRGTFPPTNSSTHTALVPNPHPLFLLSCNPLSLSPSSAMGTTMKDKGTLEFALRPYRVDWSVLEEKHAAVLGMMEIFLGSFIHTTMQKYL